MSKRHLGECWPVMSWSAKAVDVETCLAARSSLAKLESCLDMHWNPWSAGLSGPSAGSAQARSRGLCRMPSGVNVRARPRCCLSPAHGPPRGASCGPGCGARCTPPPAEHMPWWPPRLRRAAPRSARAKEAARPRDGQRAGPPARGAPAAVSCAPPQARPAQATSSAARRQRTGRKLIAASAQPLGIRHAAPKAWTCRGQSWPEPQRLP
mmetsp:Transcript_97258/g.314069  ORF Transcript_97258/g.314069 Transcript_97258/m.314069 type:complete len:209 (+) Transcript_97258:337-963(+)